MSMSAVRNAEMIIDTKLASLETIYIDRMKKKTNILNDDHHPVDIYCNFLLAIRKLSSSFFSSL